MKVLLTVLASFAFMLSLAQEETPEFGEVTLSDFGPTPFDSLSSSVVLFDKGTYGGTSYDPIIQRHVRIKIRTKDAFDLWGDFKLGNANTIIREVKAATYYVEDGEIVSHMVEEDAILTDRRSNKKIISLTNLREGCIIELSYSADRRFFLMPSWIIQCEAPVLWSEFQLLSPAKLTYLIRGGYQPARYDPKYKKRYSRWIFKNIPAFAEEPLMPHPINYFARIEFWNPSGSWNKLNDEYLEEFGRWHQDFAQDLNRLKIKNLKDSLSDPLEKVKILTRYVKDNYRWTEYRSYSPSIITTIFEEKKGSSGELNILLYDMLKEAGFNPDFVLLSTPDNGLVLKDIPSEDQFNYVLCSLVLNGKRYLLDATDPMLPFNVVPQYCLNTDGLIISKGGSSWIRIEEEIKERFNVNAWLSVSENQTLKGKITVVKQGYGSYTDHKQLNILGETNFKKESVPDKLWLVDSTHVPNKGKSDLPSVVTHFARLSGYVTEVKNKIYVNPYIMLGESKSNLRGNTREYPIDLQSKIEKRLMVNFEIPKGFKIESLPESQTISLPDKSVTCSFKISSNGKNVVVIYLFTVAKTWFEKEEFANLREFYNMVIAKQNEMIVLVKTGG